MTRTLQKVGNSRAVILRKEEMEAAGLSFDDRSQVEVVIEDDKIVIRKAGGSDPFEDLRAHFASVDPDLLDAAVDVACRQARDVTMKKIQAGKRRAR
jgi:antitoxin component of MazEF toxin-antitoxin module